MTTEHVTPAELAAIDQHLQTINHKLDNLIGAYRSTTSDGEVPREVDLLLFAGALPQTVRPDGMGALLACAIARLAEATKETP